MISSSNNSLIELVNASKSFGKKKVFENLNFSFYQTERVAITGPNGCGKTTLLKTIAGIEQLSNGSISGSSKLKVSYLPSDLNTFLLPWYSVSQNISFYLTKGKRLKLGRNKREDVFQMLQHYLPSITTDFLDKRTYQLSTGEKALIGLVCILQAPSSIFLLDELFANTSATVSDKLILFFENHFEDGKLLIFTSHNQNITSRLATRTMVMDYAT